MNYTEYKEKQSSEKIILAVANASKRLAGWSLYSGGVYYLENIDSAVIDSIYEENTKLTSVDSIDLITAGKYSFDRKTRKLYLQASDSSNPNSKFIAVTLKYFFSNNPIILPHDLNNGFDIYFEPYILDTSFFGVEIDNSIEQLGQSIDGSGSINFINDKQFWASRFDKLTWENNKIQIYSYSRDIDLSEIKTIYKGNISSKSWSLDKISFNLKDQISNLNGVYELPSLGSLSNISIPFNEFPVSQRLIFGQVNGLRPQNIDQLIVSGYKTSSIISNVTGITVNTTNVYNRFRKNDSIKFVDGLKEIGHFTVNNIISDTQFEINRAFSAFQESTINAGSFEIYLLISSEPKNYINRKFKIASHSIREASHQILGVSAPNVLRLNSIEDFEPNDLLEYNGGLTRVKSIIGLDKIRITDSLNQAPSVGDTIKKVSVTNVKIDSNELEYLRDYTYDAINAELELNLDAEFNITPIRTLSGTITYAIASNVITGVGSSFTSELNDQSYIEIIDSIGGAEPIFAKVVQINNDTELLIESNASASGSFSNIRIKKVSNFNTSNNVLTITTLGATLNGLPSGEWLKTAPQIAKHILTKVGLSDSINNTSFNTAKDFSPYLVGVVYPENYLDRNPPTYRQILNDVNRSVFGFIFQDESFLFNYDVLRPTKNSNIEKLKESDVISFSLSSDSSDIVKTVNLLYNKKEYNDETKLQSIEEIKLESNNGKYLLKTEKEIDVVTALIKENDARIIGHRWKYILSYPRTFINLETKLKLALASVSDSIEIDHRFIAERIGSNSNKQIAKVIASDKNGFNCEVKLDSISSSFSTAAIIAENAITHYSLATENEKLYSGFITDQYGLINNEQETIDLNLIW
jgi:hypothetical protein